MKKNFRKILCSLISVVTVASSTAVFAADTMEMEWRGDYSDSANPKLVVTFTAPVPYLQRVTAVIYPASDTTPTFDEYLRVSELEVNGKDEKKVTFDITSEFTEANYDYKLELKGNGYIETGNSLTQTVYAINPERIPGLLNEFANANSTTFEAVLDKVMAPLQLADEANATIKEKRISSMLKMKESDFNGAFTSLEDIRDAWIISDIMVYLGESTATAEGVKEKLLDNAGLLGIDTTDAELSEHIDDVCADLIAYGASYNNGAGIQSLSDLQNAIGEYLGVIVVNNASEDLVDDAFAKYKNYFGISSTTMTAYNNLNEANRGKALRAIYNKNFVRASELVTAFTNTVNTLSAGGDIDDPIIIVPGATGGGASISTPITPGVTEPPSTTANFKDIPSNHWAYSYVTELAQKNIINGYDDGTFRPSNNVTRAEFVKMIIGATGMLSANAECNFTDVPESAWYYEYVASAFTKGIISGMDDTTFGAGTNITRQDVAVIAARILTRLTGKTSDGTDVTLTDFDTVSDYAQDSVKLLNSMSIINGFDDGSFKPHNALTRAEAATIICKLIANL